MVSTTRSRHLPVDAKIAKVANEALSSTLLDLMELANQTRHAHWNLRDANFIAVHKQLDATLAVAHAAIDQVAERIRQLGGTVDARSSVVSKESTLPKFPTGELSAADAIANLCESLQATSKTMRAGISAVEDEPITADLLTAHCRALEEQMWLLDSHLG
ncbi:MAG: DNA starvation/stationary phase protection protein [Chthonomonas sp.]|nr:DNA starvation/stationary phase protection protein [Chthonomonas sp.]